jgi:predicted nucleic acid-binding protein
VIVADASVVVELLLESATGRALAERLLEPELPLHVPHLLDLEVTQVLRRYVRQGEVEPGRASEMLTDLLDLPLERYPHDPLIGRVWELRDNLTAYDAAYVALAEALDATLLTRDGRIQKAPGHRARVEVV